MKKIKTLIWIDFTLNSEYYKIKNFLVFLKKCLFSKICFFFLRGKITIFSLLYFLLLFTSANPANSETAHDVFTQMGTCNVGNTLLLGEAQRGIYGLSVTLNCREGKLTVKCDNISFIPECSGKNGEFINYTSDQLFSRARDKREEMMIEYYQNHRAEQGKAPLSGTELEAARKSAREYLDNEYGKPNYHYVPSSSTQTSSIISQSQQSATSDDTSTQQETMQKPSASTPASAEASTNAGKILDDKTESGKKTDLSNQSVTGSTKQPTIDGTTAMQHEKGKTTSGNVEKSSFVGASNLGDDYSMGDCGSGNIFQQLACRAGVIGSGLKTVGYMIAGFGLIVFSFAAIFGKVKWPLFATIMFSCFLLSATVFVVNMMTDKGDSGWIGGIKGNGSDYYSDNATNVPATDSGGVPDGESPK